MQAAQVLRSSTTAKAVALVLMCQGSSTGADE